jgi:multidrug efflux pump subunit AcrA (membrane-fusion protein)
VKKLIIVIVIIIVAGGAYYYFNGTEETLEAEEPTISTAKVEKGPIVMMVSTTGRVVANLDVDIKCKASGEITKLPFDISDVVKKGDLLVELDPVDEERYLKQAQISLSATEARLAQAKQNLLIAEKDLEVEKKRAESALKSAQARAEDAKAKFDRLKQLLEKKLASQEEHDTARTSMIQAEADLESAKIRSDDLKVQEMSLDLKREDVKLAEAQVESDKIALSNAKQRLIETQVYAPVDGVVAVRNVQIGQIISSGISNVGGGTTVMTLSDLSRIFVLASVDESDIGKVETGQPTRITVDAFPALSFKGKVVRIATRGVSTANVVTFEVKIEVLGRNRQLLKPEMTANIEIIADEDDNALLVPVTAVARRERGKRVVTVQKPDGSTEEREVEVGISDGVQMAIKSGLKEGETVVIRSGEADSRWREGRRGPRMMFGRRR